MQLRKKHVKEKQMIDFVFLDETHCERTGIYKIWFGNKYYIGSTIDTLDRMKYHYFSLVFAFTQGEKIGNNSTTKMVNHLLCNPHIKNAFVELIQCCNTEYDLVAAEKKWLTPCEHDANCLNYQFKVSRRNRVICINEQKDNSQYNTRDMGTCNSTG